MFIAMNRFKIVKGRESDFESVWRSRQSRLSERPGFIVFHLLKGPEREDYTLYSSHALWETKQHFLDWTHSEHFREAHKNAGQNRDLYLGGPEFEGFDVVLVEENPNYAPKTTE
ncbi:antibiotic biosynthesis monooxygenase family protein [Methylocystis parvus]|uniref:Antibiotic biosynthesis monooxygenase n=1 Tax=Methylocystis parvus TaxID=134 RepID=A0A6B8MA22_9HYPH|nr:antibiotic biosynthesis monooxygenase [Methylocystis parvus]QGM99536.1 antibiotic biosynthesis monooxygenase [Methylocystis parvus]WBK02126.1 antibiotic biosynthesis monooxygenase [Methylocystis parvus OBBP]